MSYNLNTITITTTLDDAQYKLNLSQLERFSETSFKKIASLAASHLTFRAISGFARNAIQMYSNLEEETNKFNVVFQGLGRETSRVLAELQRDFGLSELAARQMLAGTGDILTGFGFDRSVALDLSEGAAKLGADLASFSNYSGGAAGATEALTKAMLGETESAKMLGVVILQTDERYQELVQQAMTTGVTIDALGKTFVVNSEKQAKAVAALAMAYEQSPNAIGDFARSQESIANQVRILQNNLEGLYIAIGRDGSSVFSDLLQIANNLTRAYLKLEPATRSLLNSSVALAAGFALLAKAGGLAKANLAAAAMLKGVSAAYHAIATASSVAAAGQTVLAASSKRLGFALRALNTALGPVGWAIMALSIAYLAINHYLDAQNAKLERGVTLAQEKARAADEEAAANKKQRQEAVEMVKRLEEMSKYERLNNSEKAEAETLIKNLTGLYGDLGISLDSTTGKLTFAAGAWERLNATQREQAITDNLKQLLRTRNLYVAQMKRLYGEKSEGWIESTFTEGTTSQTGDVISMLEAHRNKFIAEGKNELAAQAEEAIQSLKKARELQQTRTQMLNAAKEPPSSEPPKPLDTSGEKGNMQNRSKVDRSALNDLADTIWGIRFDSAEADQQMKMLDEKIQRVFARQSGKYATVEDFTAANQYNMSEQELKDLREIIDLEEQRRKIRQSSADAFAEEKRWLLEFERSRKQQKEREELDKKLREYEKSGDKAAFDTLLQSEIDKANKAAESARREYNERFAAARADPDYTGNEQRAVDEARRAMVEAINWADELARREIDNTDAATRDNRNVAGDFSARSLAQLLGAAGTPEKETAKHTKELVTLQRRQLETLTNMGTTIAYV